MCIACFDLCVHLYRHIYTFVWICAGKNGKAVEEAVIHDTEWGVVVDKESQERRREAGPLSDTLWYSVNTF